VIGIVVTAAFFLKLIKQVFMGEFNKKWEHLEDVNKRELFTLIPLVALTVLLGVQPHLALDMMNTSAQWLVNIVKGG